MMRSNSLLDPSSWRAWDGKSYSKTFASPYGMPAGTEAEHICTVTNLPAGPLESQQHGGSGGVGGCAPAGLVWSAFLEKFVVTLGCGSKFLWAHSDDLITWSAAQCMARRQSATWQSSKTVAMLAV